MEKCVTNSAREVFVHRTRRAAHVRFVRKRKSSRRGQQERYASPHVINRLQDTGGAHNEVFDDARDLMADHARVRQPKVRVVQRGGHAPVDHYHIRVVNVQ